jgi:hypothetical protein
MDCVSSVRRWYLILLGYVYRTGSVLYNYIMTSASLLASILYDLCQARYEASSVNPLLPRLGLTGRDGCTV